MNVHEFIWRMGIEPSHWDGMGRMINPSWETLRTIMGSLGLEAESPDDLPGLAEEVEGRKQGRLIEPVIVKQAGRETRIKVNAPAWGEGSPLVFHARSEEGEELAFRREPELGEDGYPSILLPEELPNGYYDIEIEAGGATGRSLLIACPERAYQGITDTRNWGFFCPLYSLDSSESMGSGDFRSLEGLVSWMASQGGSLLGTLPLFSAYLDSPCDPSPYAPVSRLFWNEFYIDPRRAGNWEACNQARELYASGSFREALERLKAAPKIDFREEMKHRRAILELLARDFFARSGHADRRGLDEYLAAVPEAVDYARFRSAKDPLNKAGLHGASFPNGNGSGVDSDIFEYHLYAQWAAEMQIKSLREHARSQGVDLYMDLPLGVHPDGYDAWAYGDFFAEGVSGGAPPDAFFSAGQDWGFRPIHPWRSRERGHLYFRRIIRKLMQFCDVVRLDHVMSLHRLYWVPLGSRADQGAYVRYPCEEFYAILKLESHRQECVVVGEDLGTVPPEVRSCMQEQGILRMYVGQFEIGPGDDPALHEPAGPMVASVNTHDTPTFSGFAKGLDIAERVQLGILHESEVPGEMSGRGRLLQSLAGALDLSFPGFGEEWEHQLPEVLRRWLLKLAESPARYLMINLEDLWLEDVPQNVPGTDSSQKPNWKLRMKKSFGQVRSDPRIGDLLEEINKSRKG